MIFALVPPAVPELGNATGFDLWLVDETNMGHEKLLAARNQLLGIAGGDKRVAQVRPVSLEDAPQLQIKIDQDKASALGLDLSAINSEISGAWGSAYVNDFLDRGRTKRVYLQADEQFRQVPEDLENFYRSEEHTSELQSLMRISYAVFCLKKKKIQEHKMHNTYRLVQQHNNNYKVDYIK